MRRKRLAFTLTEVLIAFSLSVVLSGALYFAFSFLFSRKSASSLTNLTDRSFIQKDARMAMRKFFLRLREGTQLLSPAPGDTSASLVFRDILNDRIRLRLITAEKRIISERFLAGTWTQETKPRVLTTSGGDKICPAFPIRIPNCSNVSFTALSPTCVAIHLTLTWRGNHDSLMTAITLRNANLAN